ncbi:MAG: WYL domain-containing protein, partial [Niameybacter sp.]
PWDKIRGNNPDNPKRVQRASDLMTTSICLRVDNEKTYKYIKNKPFHNSQRANDTTHQITLELVENDTLYKRFMEFGAEITVISPESVRNTLAERARLIYENLINPQLDCG